MYLTHEIWFWDGSGQFGGEDTSTGFVLLRFSVRLTCIDSSTIAYIHGVFDFSILIGAENLANSRLSSREGTTLPPPTPNLKIAPSMQIVARAATSDFRLSLESDIASTTTHRSGAIIVECEMMIIVPIGTTLNATKRHPCSGHRRRQQMDAERAWRSGAANDDGATRPPVQHPSILEYFPVS